MEITFIMAKQLKICRTKFTVGFVAPTLVVQHITIFWMKTKSLLHSIIVMSEIYLPVPVTPSWRTVWTQQVHSF